MQADKIADDLCAVEIDMLLDFCGLESGKVRAGAAVWAIVAVFRRLGLLGGSTENCQPTALGRDVAQIILARRWRAPDAR